MSWLACSPGCGGGGGGNRHPTNHTYRGRGSRVPVMPVDPSTPTTFRLLIQGKPERKFEAEATVPYAAMRWLIGLLIAALSMTTLLSVSDAWAAPPAGSPSLERPDDQGGVRGRGLGDGTSQGSRSGVGRGNDPTGPSTSTSTVVSTTASTTGPTTTTTGPPTSTTWPGPPFTTSTICGCVP